MINCLSSSLLSVVTQGQSIMVTLPGKTQSGTEKTSLSLIYPWMTTVFTKRRRDATMHEAHIHTHARIHTCDQSLYHTSLSWLNFSTPSVCDIHLPVLYFMFLFFFWSFFCFISVLLIWNNSVTIIQHQLVTNPWHLMKITIYNQECGKNDTNEHQRKKYSITQKNDSKCSFSKRENVRNSRFLLLIFLVFWQHIAVFRGLF